MAQMPFVDPFALQTKLTGSVVLDVRTGLDARVQYETGHLPGAIFVDLDQDLAEKSSDPTRGGRHPLPTPARFAARVGAWGIDPETDVIIYDAQSGGNAAARAWWMLRALGHTRVWIVDGGYTAAVETGVSPERTIPKPIERDPYPAQRWQMPLLDIDEIDAWRRDPAKVVIDARSPTRFRGDEETLDPVAGHIPGAHNLFHHSLVGADRRMLPRAALRERIAAVIGDRNSDAIAVHCGSGVTACHLAAAMEQAGLGMPYLYVGSWSEWCRSGRPREPAAP